MATAKAVAPRKASRQAKAKAEPEPYVVLRAFTLASTGEAHLIGEGFVGTVAQAATLKGLGYIGEA